MRQDKLSKQNVILYLCGIIPVVWLGLLIAPCLKDGLPGLVQQFGSVMQNPFKIQLCEDSVKTVLTLLLVYGIAVGVYLSTEHNYRRREGLLFRLCEAAVQGHVQIPESIPA